MTHIVSIDTETIQEILRRLEKLSRDVEEIKKNTTASYPIIDEETNRQIGLSLKDLVEGRYVDVDPSDKEGLDKLAGLK